MALSTRAAKALQQFEASAYVLYGAGYFTDEEWMELDALLHKGKYAFLIGPQNPPQIAFDHPISRNEALLELQYDAEQPLLEFEGSSGDAEENSSAAEHLPNSEHETSLYSSQEEVCNNFESSSNKNVGTEDETTVPESTGEPPLNQQEQNSEKLDELFEDSTKDILGREQLSNSSFGVTRAQLDEARSLRGSSRKSSSGISDWASEVNEKFAELAVSPKGVQPPSPEIEPKKAAISKKITLQPRKVQAITQLSQDEIKRRITLFTQHHGYPPSTVTDYHQPSNPIFKPRWLTDAIVNPPILSSKAVSRSSPVPSTPRDQYLTTREPFDDIHVGKWFEARKGSNPQSRHPKDLKIACGDQIKVVKRISSNLCFGVNKRTGESGTFKTFLILDDLEPPRQKTDNNKIALLKAASFSMDELDRNQTAKWENDDEDDIQPTSSRSNITQRNSKAGIAVGGMGSSRYAARADSDHQSVNESTELNLTIVNQKIEQIAMANDIGSWRLADEAPDNKELPITRNLLNSPPSSSRETMPRHIPTREKLRQKRYEIVVPKTEVCYYWETGDRCRYSEDQCRDLHEDREYTLQTNMRNGKPNPGPLVDSIHRIPTPPFGQTHRPAQDPSTTVGKRFSCFFWHSGYCLNSEEICMFLHTYVGSEGIIHKEIQVQAFRNRHRKLIGKPKLSAEDNERNKTLAAAWATELPLTLPNLDYRSVAPSGIVSPDDGESMNKDENNTSGSGAAEPENTIHDPFADVKPKKEPWMW